MEACTGYLRLLSAASTEDKFNIPTLREIGEKVSDMCNLGMAVEAFGIEQGMQKGIQIGMEKTMLVHIRSLMETLQLSAKQAMDALKIPEGDRKQYEEKL